MSGDDLTPDATGDAMPGSGTGATPGETTQPIRALRMSRYVRERLRVAPREAGRIHSAYARTLNLLWHDGRLLTLHGSGPLLAPFAMVVDRLPRRVVSGASVRREDDVIRLGPFHLSWAGSAVVESKFRSTSEGVQFLAAVLASRMIDRAAAGLSSSAGCVAQQQLRQGIRKLDEVSFLEGASALIGLGEGLTPAGDDCLVGALAVLWRCRAAWLEKIEHIRKAIGVVSKFGTTAVGREFLLHAVDGSFSEVIVNLMNARSVGEAIERADELGRLGASSGADTLWGMRLALEALHS